MEKEPYSFSLHRHNFAVWTAARAVSRNFTNTLAVSKAIEKTELRNFAEGKKKVNPATWKEFHSATCDLLIRSLKRSKAKNPGYGRAAKIIAVYLKTSVIIPNKPGNERLKFIHPPIDFILLSEIAKETGMRHLKNIRWTQLTENKYWDLIDELKNKKYPIDWRLEKFWSPFS